MSETPTASGMSQGESGVGGDPLDLVGAVGTNQPDVLPGPAGGDVGEEGNDVPSAEHGPVTDADPAPESGATLDPPAMKDPDTGTDPLDDDAEGIRTLGVGDSGSSSDPMPDMTGTS